MSTDQFTGREWLFDEILKFLSPCQRERLLWIVGTPGTGKTSICRELESPSQMSIEKSIINNRCLHFVQAQPGERAFQTFKDDLNRILIDNYASFYDLDPLESSLEATLMRFETKNFAEHHSLLVIDDLDKFGDLTLELLSLLDRLPAWIKVLVTCDQSWFRSSWSPLSRRRHRWIALDGPQAKADLEKFLSLQLTLSQGQIRRLVGKSRSSFLFIVKSVELIRANLICATDLESIRPGLKGLYSLLRKKLNLHLIGDGQSLARLIISLVLVNSDRQHLSSSHILKRAKFSDLSTDNFESVFELVSKLFFDSQSRLFHSSLYVWWRAKMPKMILNEAIECETLFYWSKLCRFGSSSVGKTSTPLIPLSDIEFIDDAAPTLPSSRDSTRHSYYLGRFSGFLSEVEGRAQSKLAGRIRDIYRRQFGQVNESQERFEDEDELRSSVSSLRERSSILLKENCCFLKIFCCWFR